MSLKLFNKDKVEAFINKGGSKALTDEEMSEDYRMTLRIPRSLLLKIDSKRKERIAKINRTTWILEALEKMTK
jgi:hypothetical protein